MLDEGHYSSRKQVGSALTKIGICLLTVQVEMVGKSYMQVFTYLISAQ